MRFRKLLALLPSLFVLREVSAHCPLCTGAVVAGAVGAKYLGLDVTILGIFVGAFAISLGLWISRKIKNYFKYQNTLIVTSSFFLTIIPSLAFIDDMTYISLLSKTFFVNKLLIGSIIGALITLLSYRLHNYIKLKHGKVLFPYQGVVLTLLLLILSSIPVYFIFK